MSEVKLNLVDGKRLRHGTIHGSVADSCVAALSAEPETIEELDAALSRYIRSGASSHFSWFSSIDCPVSPGWSAGADYRKHRSALDAEPWDAGLVVIDMAARIVAIESTYSQPGPEGEVFYHDGQALTDVPILYRVPDDWLFVNSVDAYQWSRERRALERAANPPFDARPILFGRPLLEFIVNAYLTLPVEGGRPFSSPQPNPDVEDVTPEPLSKEISIIHARWLLTPREDLRGQAPRDVLLVRHDLIDFDLHTRSLQWSLQNEGPPCLDESSFAYRFAGFGTHELVLYYDLVRYLIYRLSELTSNVIGSLVCNDGQVEQLIAELEQIETDWLDHPQPALEGRIPAIIINNERKRLPEAIRPRDMIIDDDCPMCQMFGDETSPLGMGVGFWHLDGSHLDDDFAFSFFKTRQEYEAENRRREEFDREFNQEMEERSRRVARGAAIEPDLFFNPEEIGSGRGWFDPLIYPDSPERDPMHARAVRPDDFDDSDISDSN